MDKIEGIDLGQLVKEAEADVLREQRDKVARAVRGIVADIGRWHEERATKATELEKLDEKIAKAKDKYQKLVNGDWSVLNENMLKNQPTAETKAH